MWDDSNNVWEGGGSCLTQQEAAQKLQEPATSLQEVTVQLSHDGQLDTFGNGSASVPSQIRSACPWLTTHHPDCTAKDRRHLLLMLLCLLKGALTTRCLDSFCHPAAPAWSTQSVHTMLLTQACKQNSPVPQQYCLARLIPMGGSKNVD